LKDFLLSTSIEIDANSVKSGDDTRDEKLQKFFFKLMKTKTIKAKIQTVNDNNVMVLLSMNGIKKELTMNYTFANNLITLTATMDVMDWSLGKALDSINKACAALHENKTWSDVNLTVEVPASLECHAKI